MIAIDSNVFIYWLERNPEFYAVSTQLIKQVYSGDQPASCSAIVLTEIYNGSDQTIEAILKLPNLSIIPAVKEVTELAGKLRYKYNLKVIDAIHAASALHSGASSIITNDITFSKKKIPGLTVTLLTQLA
jgi:predicted nucleic acid-binding protein